jgi:hypothetical protein
MKNTKVVLHQSIENKIYIIRGQKVMIDRDLATLYGVETKQLKRQVNRNLERFPHDFMFELTKEEFENWRCQFGTSNFNDKMGLRYTPFAFTEHGVLMLSSVLNSSRAVQVNIEIMRIFARIRQMLSDNTELRLEIEKIRYKVNNHDKNIELVFNYLDELLNREKDKKCEERSNKKNRIQKFKYVIPIISLPASRSL